MRWALLCVIASLTFVCLAASSAHAAEFGLHDFQVAFSEFDGSPVTQAGAHPYEMKTTFFANTTTTVKGKEIPFEPVKDVLIEQIEGFAGNPSAVEVCSTVDFLAGDSELHPSCPDGSAVGKIAAHIRPLAEGLPPLKGAVFLLEPPPGAPAKLGFWVGGVPVTADVTLTESPPYRILGASREISQILNFYGAELTLWGIPADPRHDTERGHCVESGAKCPAGTAEVPFITMPRACGGPLSTDWSADSWPNPGAFVFGSTPSPEIVGCDKLAFGPEISARPTSHAATSPTGLDFSLDVEDEGLINPKPGALAGADIKRAVVTLPEGMSVNPSQAEGLGVCTQAQVARETAFSAPGDGCPEAAKIGTIEVETPLLKGEVLKGALYVAKPYENPFNSLIAFYIVIKSPELGISVVQPAKVSADPQTGQLVTTTEEMPQLPFSHFRLHFREGTRSPLVTPPACGAHTVRALLYPYSGTAPVTSTSTFEVISGPDNSPCPTGGLPPFHPGLDAGTLNNAAGHYSPFNVRLSRSDAEQEITHFSIKLPPGVIGKLAGVGSCSDAQIAAAKARTGPNGGQEEIESPSCPAASQVGRTLAGSGVGPSLAYAPGNVYLAGPYHGAPVSIVAITAGVVGPFDIGTVVVREALRIDPETAEVFIDATGSDPIPHIVQGIPVHLRDIRVYTDRPEFVLNPTGCEPTSTSSTVLGSGLDFVSPADDNPVVVSTRFQAADCAALPFHPKLSFKLVGSTKRGGNPSLRAHVAMNGIGEAAIRYAQVALPRSEFLDNAHIGTICTRTQFRTGTVPGENCPAASVYGHVSAVTPILDGPLSGPIYLRSSEHELPDLVAALHHEEINVALVGRVDSVKGGGIRNTFEFVPDAPVTSADFVFDGAAKGLLENSTNLCRGTHKAKVLLKAHSGKRVSYKTPLKPTGCKGKKGNRHHRGH